MATGDYPPTVDDLGTSLRSERAEYHRRIRVLTEDAERRVQAVRDEHAALVGECQQLAARLGAALATQEMLREELRQARETAERYRQLYEEGRDEADALRRGRDLLVEHAAKLLAVAEAVNALAKREHWDLLGGCELAYAVLGAPGLDSHGLRLAMARALLAAGMDWREPKGGA